MRIARTMFLALGALSLSMAPAGANVVLNEAGHTLTQLVDSVGALDPTHSGLEFACQFPDSGIESIGVDHASGTLFVQLEWPAFSFTSTSTCIFSVSPAGTHPVTLINPNTDFGINGRGTDLHFDPATGLLLTQDQTVVAGGFCVGGLLPGFPCLPGDPGDPCVLFGGFCPAGSGPRIATVNPVGGATGTYAMTPVFSSNTFGMDFSTGIGDVPAGDVVFTTDVGGNGIHSTPAGGPTTTHVIPSTAGDDMVIQPDGTWVHVADFSGAMTAFSPFAGHPGAASALSIQGIFNGAGLPFVHGSRATVCDITGDLYVSYSGGGGGTGLFRVDPTLNLATLVLTLTDQQGLHDLIVGPSTSGGGNSVFFTAHDGATGGEEVWEVTVPECAEPCDPDPRTQGYWHRNCLGVPVADGGITPGRNGRGPTTVLEPDFDKLLPDVTAELAALLAENGGSCSAGMVADPPSDPCEKAVKQFTALLFNLESDRLQNSCQVDLSAEGCNSTDIGALVGEVAALINSSDPDNCRVAADCAASVNEGTALSGETVVASSGPSDVTDPAQISPVSHDTETPELGHSYRSGDDSTFAREAGTADHVSEPYEPARTPVELIGAPSMVQAHEAPDVEPGGAEEESPVAWDDDLRTIQGHLAVLANASAPGRAVAVSTDALLTTLSGGYDPELRIEIVRALVDKVDASLRSLLAEHLKDIRDEARDFGKESLAKEAEGLLSRLEPSEE